MGFLVFLAFLLIATLVASAVIAAVKYWFISVPAFALLIFVASIMKTRAIERKRQRYEQWLASPAPPLTVPGRFTQEWIAVNVPRLHPGQVSTLLEEMRSRGWSGADIERRVLPYLPQTSSAPKVLPSDERAGGLPDEETATARRLKQPMRALCQVCGELNEPVRRCRKCGSDLDSSMLAMPIRREEAAEKGAADLADSVDDSIEESSEQNKKLVDKPTGEEHEKKSEPKAKAPTTAEVAGAWIRAQLEDGGPKTKEQLVELAAKSNPAKFKNPKGKDKAKVPRSTKWIVENKKVGQMMPGNAAGYYIPEGLDSSKGGVEVVFDDEEAKRLRLKP